MYDNLFDCFYLRGNIKTMKTFACYHKPTKCWVYFKKNKEGKSLICLTLEPNATYFNTKKEAEDAIKSSVFNSIDNYGFDNFLEFRVKEITTKEKLAEGFVNEAFQIVELKKQNERLQEMFDMQVRLVTALTLENEELRSIIEALTKGKLPCNPDHNGECLVCDNWLCDCPLNKKQL